MSTYLRKLLFLVGLLLCFSLTASAQKSFDDKKKKVPPKKPPPVIKPKPKDKNKGKKDRGKKKKDQIIVGNLRATIEWE